MGRKKTNFKLNMLNSWDKITLRKFQELQELYSKKEEEEISTIDLLTVLTDQTEEELRKMPLEVINKISIQLEFLTEEPSSTPSNTIEIDGETYMINTEENLTFGEWVAIEQVTKANDKDIASMIAILCRKKGEPYDVEYEQHEFEKRREMFNDQPITKIYPLTAFFLQLRNQLELASPTYLNLLQDEVMELAQECQRSLMNMGLKKLSTLYLIIKLQWLKLSVKCISLKYSISSFISRRRMKRMQHSGIMKTSKEN